MLIVVIYDISTCTAEGAVRLRKVSKICLKWGQRIQNSVFECYVNADQYRKIKAELQDVIDINCDSLRFYRLGNNYASRIEQIGFSQDKLPQEYVL